jgi:hypothetical protein
MIFEGCLNSNLESRRSKQRPISINLATHHSNLANHPSNSHTLFLMSGLQPIPFTSSSGLFCCCKACQFLNYGFLVDESFVSTLKQEDLLKDIFILTEFCCRDAVNCFDLWIWWMCFAFQTLYRMAVLDIQTLLKSDRRWLRPTNRCRYSNSAQNRIGGVRYSNSAQTVETVLDIQTLLRRDGGVRYSSSAQNRIGGVRYSNSAQSGQAVLDVPTLLRADRRC